MKRNIDSLVKTNGWEQKSRGVIPKKSVVSKEKQSLFDDFPRGFLH
jgi:hypothetical protein